MSINASACGQTDLVDEKARVESIVDLDDDNKIKENQLVLRVMEGDGLAFDTLCDIYRSRLLAFLHGFFPDGSRLEEDALSETLINAWENIDSLNEESNFNAWIFRIARNRAIDIQRRLNRHSKNVSLTTDSDASDWDPSSEDFTPLASAMCNETRNRLRKIIDSEWLRDEESEVINLFYYEGLKIKEIAESLRIPVGTVKSRLDSARNRLNYLLTHLDVGLDSFDE